MEEKRQIQYNDEQNHCRRSRSMNYSNDYVHALSELQRPRRPTLVQRVFGMADDVKSGYKNSRAIEKDQPMKQMNNVGSTLGNVCRTALNSDYWEERREYKHKRRTLTKLAKLENKRLKELSKFQVIGVPDYSNDNHNDYDLPTPQHSGNSHLSSYESFVSPQGSSLNHHNSNTEQFHTPDYKEPPPPYKK